MFHGIRATLTARRHQKTPDCAAQFFPEARGNGAQGWRTCAWNLGQAEGVCDRHGM